MELHKDGVHVSAVNNSTRGGNSTHQGPQGNKYNYLKAVPLSQIPAEMWTETTPSSSETATANATARTTTFSVSGGNGEVWLIFAQNN